MTFFLVAFAGLFIESVYVYFTDWTTTEHEEAGESSDVKTSDTRTVNICVFTLYG